MMDEFRNRFCGAFQDSRGHGEADHSRPDRRRRGLHGPGLRTVPRRPSDSGDAGQRRRRQRPRGLDPRPDRRCPWSANAPFLLFISVSDFNESQLRLFPDKMGSKRRSSDIISLLVSIYGSKDIFIDEYRAVLADRLLHQLNYNTARYSF